MRLCRGCGALWERQLCSSCVSVRAESVRSLALPGNYKEKITHLGRSLFSFSKLKHIDLSRNAIESLQVRHVYDVL